RSGPASPRPRPGPSNGMRRRAGSAGGPAGTGPAGPPSPATRAGRPPSPPPPRAPGWSGELVLVGGRDRLGDDHLRRRRRGTDGADELLQFRVGEELLEVLGALPFVHDEDEAVSGPETMMNAARRAGHLGVL